MTTCSSAAYGTRHRRGGAAPDGAPSSAIRIRAVVPAPHSHVAKCSIFVARGPGGLLPFATSRSLTRRRRPRTHSRTHPQHARTHRHRKRSIGRCVFSPSCTAPRAAPTTLRPQILRHARRLSFSSSGFPPFSWPAVLSFFSFRVASAAPSFCLLSRCAARHACPHTKTRSLARAPTIDGRTTRHTVRRHG